MLEFSENQRVFVKGILPFLPDRVYLHVHPEIIDFFEEEYSIAHMGVHKKMYLTENQNHVFDSSVTQITDQDKASEFYRLSYPDNFFNPEILKTGAYLGILEDDEILAIAGVHVYSEQYGVAALGNIATRPDKRRMGLGEKGTEALIAHLSSKFEHIGQNVAQNNVSARNIYERLGFIYVGTYLEAMCTS